MPTTTIQVTRRGSSRTPHAVAIVDADKAPLTYATLVLEAAAHNPGGSGPGRPSASFRADVTGFVPDTAQGP